MARLTLEVDKRRKFGARRPGKRFLFLRRTALIAPWIRDIQGKERGTLKLSDVGSFDGISTGISDDFPGRPWREILSQRTVKVSIFVPQGVRTPRFEAGRAVEWLEIPRG